MRVRAQMSMLFHLDKCIGCHTCSVACKNLWTDREGAEYMWWNNVETRPGTGYPTGWEDQEHYKGGWRRDKKGRLKLTLHSKGGGVAKAFYNPSLPELEDYYDPFTFKYGDLFTSPQSTQQPTAVPISKITGDEMEITTGPNWDDDLGGSNLYAANDPVHGRHRPGHPGAARRDRASRLQLPAPHLQPLPEPVLRRGLPERCDLQASRRTASSSSTRTSAEAGACVCRPAPTRRSITTGPPGKSEKCILCFPRLETGQAPACAHSCVGRIRYMGVLLYDADKIARSPRRPTTNCSTLSSTSSSIRRSRGGCRRARVRHRRRLDRFGPALSGVQVRQGMGHGPPAPPRVPHAGDDVLHPAALADHEHRREQLWSTWICRPSGKTSNSSTNSTRPGFPLAIWPTCSQRRLRS